MEKPLTIFLVSFDWTDLAGRDPKTFIARLDRDKLHPDKNRFVVWSWGPGRYERDLSPTVHVIRRSARLRFFRPFYDALSFFVIPGFLARSAFKPDFILVYDFPLALALSRSARRLTLPLVLGLTNLPRSYITARNSLKWPKLLYQFVVERFAVPRIDAVYTINEAIRSYCRSRGIPDKKITVFITDVITRDRAPIEKADSGFLRSLFSIPLNHKILLCVARLHAEKGIDVLLEAFASLSNKNLSLVIAGEGPLEHELQALSATLGIAGRVIFAGHLSRADTWSAYKGADAFILLSKAEGLGLVFWEAFMMNVPTIGSHADGIEETIGPQEERGFLWEPNDGVAALEERIQKSLNRTADVEERVQKAKMYVEGKLADTTDIYTLYKRIIK